MEWLHRCCSVRTHSTEARSPTACLHYVLTSGHQISLQSIYYRYVPGSSYLGLFYLCDPTCYRTSRLREAHDCTHVLVVCVVPIDVSCATSPTFGATRI